MHSVGRPAIKAPTRNALCPPRTPTRMSANTCPKPHNHPSPPSSCGHSHSVARGSVNASCLPDGQSAACCPIISATISASRAFTSLRCSSNSCFVILESGIPILIPPYTIRGISAPHYWRHIHTSTVQHYRTHLLHRVFALQLNTLASVGILDLYLHPCLVTCDIIHHAYTAGSCYARRTCKVLLSSKYLHLYPIPFYEVWAYDMGIQ